MNLGHYSSSHFVSRTVALFQQITTSCEHPPRFITSTPRWDLVHPCVDFLGSLNYLLIVLDSKKVHTAPQKTWEVSVVRGPRDIKGLAAGHISQLALVVHSTSNSWGTSNPLALTSSHQPSSSPSSGARGSPFGGTFPPTSPLHENW